MVGGVQGPQDASFAVMNNSIKALVNVIKADPAVANVNAYTGGSGGGIMADLSTPRSSRWMNAKSAPRRSSIVCGPR